MPRIRNRRKSNRKGAVTVEFAIVFPVILFVFLGAVELTNLNMVRNLAMDAAFNAARAAIVPGTALSSAEDVAKTKLTNLGIKSATFTSSSTATTVTFTVTVPVDQNSWGVGRFIAGKQIVKTCTLSKEVAG